MTTLLLRTKLYIPPLHPNLVPRPRLVEREENRGLTTRIYSTRFGTWNKVTLEVEYETEEDRQKYWAGVEWTGELAEFVETHHDMLELGQTRELLELH